MSLESLTYDDVVAAHEWNVPEHYNIAEDVCDKHPPDKLAMVHEDFTGAVRGVRWGELQELSNRFANVLRDHGRRRGAEARAYERVSAADGSEWSEESERLDERDSIRRALAQLPDDEREAVALFYGADLSVEEIARITGARAGAVKQRLYRARERMRETLS